MDADEERTLTGQGKIRISFGDMSWKLFAAIMVIVSFFAVRYMDKVDSLELAISEIKSAAQSHTSVQAQQQENQNLWNTSSANSYDSLRLQIGILSDRVLRIEERIRKHREEK